ncbi:vasoactive intestinal polypeptide receptor 2-like isoform X2 [Ailuropoda melanoleuca]|uniref:vasoactive intestinal polypeptide receptor 2-like isoform X2 n=1 Tax=Ailuropoda melanoleuca TaxID=9646 RepID=UPI0014940FCE|nr:vasoactive intestinal polypeptide receptor 2-like isoform X2 [Ailuropoda melanoleuca]
MKVNSVHPECRFHLEIQEEETKCAELLRTQTEKYKVDPPCFRFSQQPVAPTLDRPASDCYQNRHSGPFPVPRGASTSSAENGVSDSRIPPALKICGCRNAYTVPRPPLPDSLMEL